MENPLAAARSPAAIRQGMDDVILVIDIVGQAMRFGKYQDRKKYALSRS
jgi:hypothetical protein